MFKEGFKGDNGCLKGCARTFNGEACFSSHELVLEEVMLLKNVYPWSLNICVKYVA